MFFILFFLDSKIKYYQLLKKRAEPNKVPVNFINIYVETVWALVHWNYYKYIPNISSLNSEDVPRSWRT